MYPLLKHLHVAIALITAALFLLRLGLDLAGRPWRHTALRILPHLNDTLLLASAVGLTLVTGWYPLAQGWLTAKVVLLLAYIGAGKVALDERKNAGTRHGAAALALLLLAGIFAHAVFKPY